MQHPKCVEKLAVHYLTNEFAENLCLVTPSRGSSAGRTRIGKMNEVKNTYSSTFTGGTPCKRKLDFYDQEEEVCNVVTQTTIKRRKECLGVPALSLSLNESNIRPGSDLLNKKQKKVRCLR